MIRGPILVSLALMPLALPAVAAPVDSSELARCHAMASRDQQLDCYEALAAAAASKGTTALVAPTASDPSGSAPPTAPLPSAPGVAPVPGGQRAALSAAPYNPGDPANFGLSRRQVDPPPGGPTAVKSIVSQMTEDRLHNVTVLLENGQTWTFIEPEPRLRPGDSVTIKRASLGSFLMLTPSRRSYRVERTR